MNLPVQVPVWDTLLPVAFFIGSLALIGTPIPVPKSFVKLVSPVQSHYHFLVSFSSLGAFGALKYSNSLKDEEDSPILSVS